MKRIIIILLILVFLLPVCAGAESTVNVDGVDFTIPQKYSGGELTDSCYMLNNAYTFRILSLASEKNLKLNFGYDSSSDDVLDIRESYVGGHNAVVIYSNKTICEHEVVSIYYACGDKIFVISYNGSEVTPEIEKMIENTPESSISGETLYNTLADAQLEYVYDLEQEENEIELENAIDNALEKHQSQHSRFFIFYHKSYT